MHFQEFYSVNQEKSLRALSPSMQGKYHSDSSRWMSWREVWQKAREKQKRTVVKMNDNIAITTIVIPVYAPIRDQALY